MVVEMLKIVPIVASPRLFSELHLPSPFIIDPMFQLELSILQTQFYKNSTRTCPPHSSC